jgi:phage terminase small subunit
MEKVEVLSILAKAKLSRQRAVLYADAFLEYREAQQNIEKNGSIVADPRTGAPVSNPYLTIRDKAFARLEQMHKCGVNADALWK